MNELQQIDVAALDLKDQVVNINRVTKVVKGGKNLSFTALVVVGDPEKHVVGYAKGKVNVLDHTIPHVALGVYGAGRVLLKPARAGKGTIAGGAVRAVVEAAGIQNVLTKSIGTKNPHNVVKATFEALKQLREKNEVAAIRGIDAQRM